MRHRARPAILTLLATLLALPAEAQSTVASTFGSGFGYSSTAYPIRSDQSIAQSFVYGGGAGFELFEIRLALRVNNPNPYVLRFLEGTDIGTAAERERWTLDMFTSTIGPTAVSDIATFTSVGGVGLIGGATYWLELTAAGDDTDVITGWNWSNDAAQTGLWSRGEDGVWDFSSPSRSAAYDVSVRQAGVPVPEPGSAALLASGIVGLALLRRRRSTA